MLGYRYRLIVGKATEIQSKADRNTILVQKSESLWTQASEALWLLHGAPTRYPNPLAWLEVLPLGRQGAAQWRPGWPAWPAGWQTTGWTTVSAGESGQTLSTAAPSYYQTIRQEFYQIICLSYDIITNIRKLSGWSTLMMNPVYTSMISSSWEQISKIICV